MDASHCKRNINDRTLFLGPFPILCGTQHYCTYNQNQIPRVNLRVVVVLLEVS